MTVKDRFFRRIMLLPGCSGFTVAIAVACSTSDLTSPPPGTVAVVTVVPASVTVAVGGVTQLVAVLTDASGSPVSAPVTWSTSDPSVAAVSDSGLVSGEALGAAIVTAASNGQTDTASITVTSSPPLGGTVASVTVVPGAVTLAADSVRQVVAVLTDASGNPVSAPVTWSSSNPSIATVSDSGLVRAVAPGSAVATAAAGGKTGTVSITVTGPPPPAGAGEPVYDPAVNALIWRDSMDGYGPTAQAVHAAAQAWEQEHGDGTWPGFSSDPTQPYDADVTLITGRGGAGKAWRASYEGTYQESHAIELTGLQASDYTKPLYVTHWARIIAPNEVVALKWIELWHATGRIQFSIMYDTRHGNDPMPCGLTLWRFYDDPASADDGYLGQQPVGPCFNALGSDGGQWHRFTYAYKSHTSSGNKDGLVMMWIDGTKIIDVRQSQIGVVPAGGTHSWCEQQDVDHIDIGSNGRVYWLAFPANLTSAPGPFTIDWDDFVMWQ